MSEEWYRDRVVWGFYEEKTPKFYQGKDGEHEICEPVSAKQVSFYVSRIEEYDALVKELFRLLDITEQTDEGRLFHPNRIYSRRVLDAEKLEKVLSDLKAMIKDTDNV